MIIDADTHFLPPDAFDYMGDEWEAVRPRLSWDEEGLFAAIDFPGAPARVPGSAPNPPPGTGARYRGTYYIDDPLRDYEKLGIDRQFLFPQFTTILFSYLVAAPLATAMAHSWNVAILKLIRAYPRQLVGGALVALQDVEASIKEMQWAHENGFGAVILELNFVFTESGVSFLKPLVNHLDSVFSNNFVDYESEDAAPRFNYRKLTGGRRIVSEEDYRAKNKRAPSDYFKKNIHFTIETEEPELAEAIHSYGPTQFLFATDYPHDDPGGRMKYKDVALFTANTAIGADDKDLIWYKNAQRLLANATR